VLATLTDPWQNNLLESRLGVNAARPRYYLLRASTEKRARTFKTHSESHESGAVAMLDKPRGFG
jgi:hypothetical protein